MTVVLTLSAIVFGIMSYKSLPVNDLPAVDYPVIQVSAGYPGASPDTVAATIATPLERQFMQIPGLEVITSSSKQGFVSMVLQFDLNKSIDAAATDVQAAITRATGSLPQDLPAPPTFTKTNPNDQPIIYAAVTSDTMTVGELYDIANTQIGQRISILNGVSQVNVYGTKSAVRIKANPSALAARGLSMTDLANAIQAGTSYQGAGQFDGPNTTFLLSPQGQLDDAEAYNKLVIAKRDGAPVYLRDVATATDSVEDDRIRMRFWARGTHVPSATVMVAVSRQAGSNAVDVAQRVFEVFPQIQMELPASVRITPVHDRSQTIVHSVNDVTETLYIAFVLVIIVIYLFLGRATDTLIPIVALPLSLLLTFIVMAALGYSLDNLSLMALTLAIGFLVDDAIVFLENAVRRMEHYNESPMKAAIDGAKEISFTILAMTLSLSAVFIPLLFMSGLVGRIFREFAVTIVVSILASGLVSLTLTPLMCARMLSGRGVGSKKTRLESFSKWVENKVLGVYGRSLWFFLKHKWISALLWLVCVGGTGALLLAIPKTFLPVGDSSFIFGLLIGPEGASPQQMRQYQNQTEEQLQKDPSVHVTFTMTGNNRFLGSNQGLVLAFLDDPKDRPPMQVMGPDGKMHEVEHPTIQQIAGSLMGNIGQHLQGAMTVLQPQPVLDIATGAARRQGGQFSFAVSGINQQEVYDTSRKLMAELQKKQGTVFSSVISDLYDHTPNLAINILRDKASQYNVSARSIETLLRNAYSQNYVYLIKRASDQYQVILETQDDLRQFPDDLGDLYVRSDDGRNLVPIRAVATWEPVLGPQSVNHLNQFTAVTINFNLMPGVPIGDAVQTVQDIASQVVPPQLRSEFQGEALTFQETISSLGVLLLLAIFVMYVILGILYESYIHPITVLSTLPPAMVGGLLTLWLFGQDASLYAFIGLFMLMGIVKKNGILIVDFATQRIADGETAIQAIHDASMDRFRPIIMTTLAAIMGAVPIAIAWGTSGAERQPLGLVIVGGLLVAQVITLYVTPAIYLYMEMFQEKVLNRIPFFATHYEGHGHQLEEKSEYASDNNHNSLPPAPHRNIAVETAIGAGADGRRDGFNGD